MTASRGERAALVEALAAAGCVAPEEEADDLIEAAGGDAGRLMMLVGRRVAGEPLAWVTGWANFAGHRLNVAPGVYTPRWQTEALARRAAEVLPERGVAVDLCTGSGAIAVVLAAARPQARVLATDIDPVACRCAAGNGAEVFEGDLAIPLPADVAGRVDVVTAVVPYVPTEQFEFLPRDVREHEPRLALDGGPGGTQVLERAAAAAAGILKPGGVLLLELGGDQDQLILPVLQKAGFDGTRRYVDDEGDLRALEAHRLFGGVLPL